MDAEKLINNNSLSTRDLPYVVNQDGKDQEVVFKEIALTAINIAKKEGADALIEQSSQNSQSKYKLGREEMKEKAIEAFRSFVEDYCSESGRKDIDSESEHYIEVFKIQLEEKQ